MAGETVVVGLGRSNLAAVRYLISQGREPLVLDTREQPPLLAELPEGVEFRSGSLDSFADLLAQVGELIVGPGIAVATPAIAAAAARGVPVIGDIELFVREARAPVVAVTGSNGKSTVTTLVGLMGSAAGIRTVAGGNLGTPALELLNSPQELYVLELSSFQLETTFSLRARACTILNVTEDHMDRYNFDLEKYAAAKRIIYRNAEGIVCNRADHRTLPPEGFAGSLITFGADPSGYGLVTDSDGTWLVKDSRRVLNAGEMKIAGRHNQLNALAAMALADMAGISEDAQLKVLREFPGLEHRCQLVAEIGGVRYYNDSKATNVGSTLAAVDGLSSDLKGSLYLLAGGIGKGQNFAPVGALLGKQVRRMFCYGRDAAELLRLGPEAVPARDMEDALRMASAAAVPGDVVLLAPACASMDMFRNFEERGEVFASLVRSLGGGQANG